MTMNNASDARGNGLMIPRRYFLLMGTTAVAAALIPRELLAGVSVAPVAMTVYKSPTCGCCKDWVKHMEANGFAVKAVDLDDVEDLPKKKRQLGVPAAVQSCHTGVVGAYLIEGHVPADLVKKLLTEKPAVAGLTVPGMVVGSPGMEVGSRKDHYDVLSFTKAGKTSVYARR